MKLLCKFTVSFRKSRNRVGNTVPPGDTSLLSSLLGSEHLIIELKLCIPTAPTTVLMQAGDPTAYMTDGRQSYKIYSSQPVKLRCFQVRSDRLGKFQPPSTDLEHIIVMER